MFSSNIDKVWNVVTDNKDVSWRTDLEDIKVYDEKNFTEIDKNDYEVNFEITDFKPKSYYSFKND